MRLVDTNVPGPKRDLIGYGASPPKVTWPDGAALALNIVVNYEEGSEYSKPAGDDRNEGQGELDYLMDDRYRDLGVESSYEYGSRALSGGCFACSTSTRFARPSSPVAWRSRETPKSGRGSREPATSHAHTVGDGPSRGSSRREKWSSAICAGRSWRSSEPAVSDRGAGSRVTQEASGRESCSSRTVASARTTFGSPSDSRLPTGGSPTTRAGRDRRVG